MDNSIIAHTHNTVRIMDAQTVKVLRVQIPAYQEFVEEIHGEGPASHCPSTPFRRRSRIVRSSGLDGTNTRYIFI